MSTDSSSPKPEGTDAQRLTNNGWLASLRARLGLAGPQTLRDTLEEALKEADRNGTAFSTPSATCSSGCCASARCAWTT